MKLHIHIYEDPTLSACLSFHPANEDEPSIILDLEVEVDDDTGAVLGVLSKDEESYKSLDRLLTKAFELGMDLAKQRVRESIGAPR